MEEKQLQKNKVFNLLSVITLTLIVCFLIFLGIHSYYVKFIPYQVGTPPPHFIQTVNILKFKLAPILLILGLIQIFIIYVKKFKVTKKQKIISWLAIACSLSKILFFLETIFYILFAPRHW